MKGRMVRAFGMREVKHPYACKTASPSLRFLARVQVASCMACIFGVREADRQRGLKASKLIHPSSPFSLGALYASTGADRA